jgi:photosystem II stability/assembly factor-like uncharacterized protein
MHHIGGRIKNVVSGGGTYTTSISVLSLRLLATDATTITGTGNNVSQWNDKSSSANNATKVATGTSSSTSYYNYPAFGSSFSTFVATGSPQWQFGAVSDDGATWFGVTSSSTYPFFKNSVLLSGVPTPTTGGLSCVACSSNASVVLIIGNYNNLTGFVYYSTNTGTSWTQITASPINTSIPYNCVVSSNGNTFAISLASSMVVSTDQGTTWTTTGTPRLYKMVISTDGTTLSGYSSTNLVYLNTGGGSFSTGWTTNNGSTNFTSLGITSYYMSKNKLYSLVGCNGTNLYLSTDKGTTYNRLTNAPTTGSSQAPSGVTYWEQVVISDSGQCIIGVTQGRSGGYNIPTHQISTDAGNTWTSLFAVNGLPGDPASRLVNANCAAINPLGTHVLTMGNQSFIRAQLSLTTATTTVAAGTVTTNTVTNLINAKNTVSLLNSGLTGNISFTNQFAFFCVAQFTSLTNGTRILAFGNANSNNDVYDNNKIALVYINTLQLYSNYQYLSTANITLGTPYLISCYCDGTYINFGLNANYRTMPYTTSINVTKYTIGLNSYNNNEFIQNTILGEVSAYNTNPATADRQKIEGYFAWNWGLNASLPVSHPYYSVAPT